MNGSTSFAGVPATGPHSGHVEREGYLWSDVALFLFVACGLWLMRRSMRARAKARRATDDLP